MKCSKCWFSTTIGAGIYADYPVKYCKHRQEYAPTIIEADREAGE